MFLFFKKVFMFTEAAKLILFCGSYKHILKERPLGGKTTSQAFQVLNKISSLLKLYAHVTCY